MAVFVGGLEWREMGAALEVLVGPQAKACISTSSCIDSTDAGGSHSFPTG